MSKNKKIDSYNIHTTLKENAILREKASRLESEDLRIRSVLCELLGSYTPPGAVSFSHQGFGKIHSWEGVAFLIGELKADADYAMCISAREELKMEIQVLRQKLSDKNNPNSQKDN